MTEMKSEIYILFVLTQGIQGYKTLDIWTRIVEVMSINAFAIAVAPPIGRLGSYSVKFAHE